MYINKKRLAVNNINCNLTSTRLHFGLYSSTLQNNNPLIFTNVEVSCSRGQWSMQACIWLVKAEWTQQMATRLHLYLRNVTQHWFLISLLTSNQIKSIVHKLTLSRDVSVYRPISSVNCTPSLTYSTKFCRLKRCDFTSVWIQLVLI